MPLFATATDREASEQGLRAFREYHQRKADGASKKRGGSSKGNRRRCSQKKPPPEHHFCPGEPAPEPSPEPAPVPAPGGVAPLKAPEAPEEVALHTYIDGLTDGLGEDAHAAHVAHAADAAHARPDQSEADQSEAEADQSETGADQSEAGTEPDGFQQDVDGLRIPKGLAIDLALPAALGLHVDVFTIRGRSQIDGQVDQTTGLTAARCWKLAVDNWALLPGELPQQLEEEFCYETLVFLARDTEATLPEALDGEHAMLMIQREGDHLVVWHLHSTFRPLYGRKRYIGMCMAIAFGVRVAPRLGGQCRVYPAPRVRAFWAKAGFMLSGDEASGKRSFVFGVPGQSALLLHNLTLALRTKWGSHLVHPHSLAGYPNPGLQDREQFSCYLGA